MGAASVGKGGLGGGQPGGNGFGGVTKHGLGLALLPERSLPTSASDAIPATLPRRTVPPEDVGGHLGLPGVWPGLMGGLLVFGSTQVVRVTAFGVVDGSAGSARVTGLAGGLTDFDASGDGIALGGVAGEISVGAGAADAVLPGAGGVGRRSSVAPDAAVDAG